MKHKTVESLFMLIAHFVVGTNIYGYEGSLDKFDFYLNLIEHYIATYSTAELKKI